MKRSGIHFYLVHATPLNFSEEARRHTIVRGASMFASNPVKNSFEKDFHDVYDGPVPQFVHHDWKNRLQVTHVAI